MKRIIYFLAAALAFGSCNDLDLTPRSSLTSSNILSSDKEAIAVINGVYAENATLSPRIAYLTDLSADAVQGGEDVTSTSGAAIGVFKHNPNTVHVLSIWEFLYEGIGKANLAIDLLEKSSVVTPALKARLIAEAKFQRALWYYHIVQLWGDAPLVLHYGEGQNTTRASVDAVYTQIVEDLKYAATDGVLPITYTETTDIGRVTNGAAYTLLAKTYLVWKQTSAGAPADAYTLSVNAANSVQGYALQENFLENWSTVHRDGKENIFSAHHAILGNNHLCHCAFSNGFVDATPHLVVSNISFYNKFDDRDQRKTVTFAKTLIVPNVKSKVTGGDSIFVFTLPRFQKYIDPLNLASIVKTMDIDRTILRYSDVLLTKAEALNELGQTTEAWESLNIVRRRAFRQPLDHPSAEPGVDLSGSANDFRKAIQDERFFEFTYEQQRYFDLVRWRIYVKTVKAVPGKELVELKHYRFPIPQSQRNINPTGLWQNWGYDGYDEAKTGANPYAGFE